MHYILNAQCKLIKQKFLCLKSQQTLANFSKLLRQQNGSTICSFSLQFTKGHPDGLHLQEFRHIAIILMAMAFTHFLTRKSTDKATEISLLWSRTVVIHTCQPPIIKFLVIGWKVKTLGENIASPARSLTFPYWQT